MNNNHRINNIIEPGILKDYLDYVKAN